MARCKYNNFIFENTRLTEADSRQLAAKMEKCVKSKCLPKRKALSLLAGKIRSLRSKKKITLEKLAGENNINRNNLSDIENGKRNPNFCTLVRIAGGLNCHVKDLLDF
jgi:DNA-binding XRE family transcriptional regulator